MKIKIVSNFHVFVPKEGRDRRVALTAGAVVDANDVPAGQSAQDWVDKGLAAEVDAVDLSEGVEAGAAV